MKIFILIIIFFKIPHIFTVSNISFISNYDERQKREILRHSQYAWKEKEITYYVDPKLNHIEVKVALNRIKKETCLTFVQKQEYRQSLFAYMPGRFFETNLGKGREIPHKIFLPLNVHNIGKIIRETLRAFGVDYEHNRRDRNKYISVSSRNIHPIFRKYFDHKLQILTTTYGTEYDYRSIMHFDPYEYSKGRCKVIHSKDKLMSSFIGKSQYLTFNDAKLLNGKYCSFLRFQHPVCRNYGYQNPRNPTTCKCLPYLIGNQCENIGPNNIQCTQQNVYTAKYSVEDKQLRLGPNCAFFIKAQPKVRVAMELKFITPIVQRPIECNEDNSIEIKYKNDLSISGTLFCPYGRRLYIKSKENYIVIVTNSIQQNYILNIAYVQI
ncbi:Astacin-like metalloendopeptidase [Strongyloides ratti]|uniref:Metalloendopeptidase n=1 Tax=Strongyloides ratti TaxID=34506 RepID=A0A090L0T8_STRRB|nr:Astacin-like metalloendopeptidase [Strongyloides ratti]CEF61702.1 Astacin-like metalloendopeptidase [Strongyloides ratti]